MGSAAGAGRGSCESALLTGLYQLNMMQAYLDHGKTGTAVFELFMPLIAPAAEADRRLREPGATP